MEFPPVIDLNVGGKHLTTSLATLTKYPDSTLAAMFSGRHQVTKDKDGRFFLDVDGELFVHVLRYLRVNRLPPAEVAVEVQEYARYFGLEDLHTRLKDSMPVRAKAFMDKLRSQFLNYKPQIEGVKQYLLSNQIQTPCVYILVSGQYCNHGRHDSNGVGYTPGVFGDFCPTYQIRNVSFSQVGDMLAMLTAVLENLKDIGVVPDNDIVYSPKACQYSVARRVRLVF